MRILSNLTLAAAILAGGALLIPAVANAEDHSVSPVGFGELLVGSADGRRSETELTVFKSLGLAVEDLAAAEHVVRRAEAEGVGQVVSL